MIETKRRKLAAFTSLVVAAGNFGVVAITINVGTFGNFMMMLPTSPQLQLVVVTGISAMIIGVLLATKIEFGKKSVLAALLMSIIIFAIAAAQMSIVLLCVLLWPWSLYRLYQSVNA